MDFNDYIQNLNDLDNQEVRAELETFYTLNSTIFRFFRLIDKTIIDLLKQPNISSSALNELKSILPQLSKLKKEISSLEPNILSDNKIEQAINYIKNEMLLSEVTESYQDFRKRCEDRRIILAQQKEETAIALERNKKVRKERNSRKKHLIVFKYEPTFWVDVEHVNIFINDSLYSKIEQNQILERYLYEGNYKIKIEYAVQSGGFFESTQIKNRIIEFYINLISNQIVRIKAKGGWSEHKLYYSIVNA